jgi:hypothetical protein
MASINESFEALRVTALKVKAGRDTLLEAAIEAINLIEGYVDVVDGPNGAPQMNKAMRARQVLVNAIRKAER